MSCDRSPCSRPSGSSTRPKAHWARTTRRPATPRGGHGDRPGAENRGRRPPEGRLGRGRLGRPAVGGRGGVRSSYQASRWTGEQAKGSLRGPVLVRAVLRWYQHPDRSPTARAMILGIGCVVLLGTLAWIATFRSASRSSRHLPAANALVGEGRRLRVAMGGAGLWSRRSSALATFDTDWYHL